MPRAHVEVELPGVEGTFTILQLPAEQSYWLLLDILALVAPGAAKTLKEANGLELGKLDVGTIAEALTGVVARANRAEVQRITVELFRHIEWQGRGGKLLLSQKGALDKAFESNPLGILMLQKEALKVNYAPFFSGLAERLKGVVEEAKTKRASRSGGSSTSGGPSGDSSPSESPES